MLILKLIVAIIAGVVAVRIASKGVSPAARPSENPSVTAPRYVLMAVLFLLGVLVLLSGIGQIPTGSRGVVLRFGKVTGRILQEGVYVVTPLLEGVQLMDVRTRAFEAEADAASK